MMSPRLKQFFTIENYYIIHKRSSRMFGCISTGTIGLFI